MGTMKIGHTNWCRKCLAALFIGPGTSLRISCSEDGEAVKLSKLSKEWLGTVALLLVERISCQEDNTACNTSTDSVLWSRPLVDLSYEESSFLYLAWDWSYCIPSSRGLDIVVGFLLISCFFSIMRATQLRFSWCHVVHILNGSSSEPDRCREQSSWSPMHDISMRHRSRILCIFSRFVNATIAKLSLCKNVKSKYVF